MCAQKSLMWTTGATGDGATAYTQAEVIRWQRQTFCGADNEGVCKDYLNELITTGASSPVATNTGAAYVYGFPVWNTASVDTAIATPAANTRIDRLVLRAGWAAQTIRITRIAGTEGTGNPPALVQTDGTTWDIPLCQVSITTGGVITLTDEREFLHPNIAVDGDMIDNDEVDSQHYAAGSVDLEHMAANSVDSPQYVDGSIDLAHMAANSVDSTQYVDGSIDTAHLGNLQVTSGKLAADAVVAGKIADGAVDITATLANNIVDDTKAGNRVPQFYRRQGGSATIWSTSGTTSHTPTAVRMQAGCREWTGGAIDTGVIAVTFPTAFAYAPLVVTTIYAASDAQNDITVAIQGPTTTAVNLVWIDTGGGTHTSVKINWLAIGPE